MTTDCSAPHAFDPARLNIALMVHRFPVISETFVATLAAGLKPRVADFRILATGDEIQPGPHHAVVARANLMENLQLSDRGGRMRFSRARALSRDRRDHRLKLWALTLLDQIAPRGKMALTRMLAEQPAFDVVHCQFGYEGLAALRHRKFGTLRTRALVVHFRGSDITRHVQENGDDVYADLFAQADYFLANCEYFRQRAIGLGCPADRIVVVGSPIDTDRFVPPLDRRPDDGVLRLVAVGRLVDKKGFGDAIAAIGLLDDMNVQLDILGEGPLRPEFEAQIARLGIGDRVRLHGAATADQVLSALQAGDIGLAPSVVAENGDADAPVNTLKEAMATELPVIATRHGGIPELVIAHENGLLVPEHDPQAIAGAVRQMAAMRDLWAGMGRAGRERVIAQYGQAQIFDRTLAAYAAALEHAKGRT